MKIKKDIENLETIFNSVPSKKDLEEFYKFEEENILKEVK